MEHSTQHALEWFSSNGFMPHGHCYLWAPSLLWTFVISESIIVLSYISISLALIYFVNRRKDLQFNWMFKLFAAFIFACSTTHLLDIWTIWHPDYWLDALVNTCTAGLSLIAAVLLWRLIPRALHLPGMRQMAEANAQLQSEIQQRAAAEQELSRLNQNSDERYRTLFEQAAVGVAEVDSNSGAFLRINQKLCDILGYDKAEMLRMHFESIIHADDLPAARLNTQALQVGSIPEFTMEKRCFRKDSSSIWLNMTVSPTLNTGSLPGTHIAIVQDITARKLAEEALQSRLDELQRWHKVTLDRETRVQELKREVNEILIHAGDKPRYASVSTGEADAA